MRNLTLLLNLQPGQRNTALLQVATKLVGRLDAHVIGVAAWQPIPVDWTAGDYLAANFSKVEGSQVKAVLAAAETEFRSAFPGADSDWSSHASFAAPSVFVLTQTHRADLVLTGTGPCDGTDEMRAAPADLVMHSGRPVLVVPPAISGVGLDRVMLAWKDTPECRRAASDAFPLLTGARHVVVVALSTERHLPEARQQVSNVAAWLARRGVAAETRASVIEGDDAVQLEAWARSLQADLVVAGAYGHCRLREWAFGGVTRALLEQQRHYTMLSH